MTDRSPLLHLPLRSERPPAAKRVAGKRRRLMRLVEIERHHVAERLGRS